MQKEAWNSFRINALSGAYWSSCALHAGVRLGVTAELAKSPATVENLAAGLGLDLRGLEMLLVALANLGILQRDGDTFAMNPEATKYFLPGGDEDMSGIIRHHANLVPNWYQLEKCVQSGEPVGGSWSEEESDDFYRGMRDLARHQAKGLAKRLGFMPGWHVLDLGGGPGVYGYTFADEVPELKATVFDLPASEKRYDEEGLSHTAGDRVSRINGSYRDTALGGPYDAVWLSHVLHSEGPKGCDVLVQKAAEVLKPGGVLWIQEFVVDPSGQGHPFPALFGLNMLVQTKKGQAYSLEEIKGMMLRAGLAQAKAMGPTVPGSAASLVKGEKPA